MTQDIKDEIFGECPFCSGAIAFLEHYKEISRKALMEFLDESEASIRNLEKAMKLHKNNKRIKIKDIEKNG